MSSTVAKPAVVSVSANDLLTRPREIILEAYAVKSKDNIQTIADRQPQKKLFVIALEAGTIID